MVVVAANAFESVETSVAVGSLAVVAPVVVDGNVESSADKYFHQSFELMFGGHYYQCDRDYYRQENNTESLGCERMEGFFVSCLANKWSFGPFEFDSIAAGI